MKKSIVITCSSNMKRKSCDDVEMIPVNEYVAVLTKRNSQLWKLDKDDTMALYHTDQLLRQMSALYETIWVGYIKDDVLHGKKKLETNDGVYHFTAPEDGMYCLCFMAAEILQFL